MMKKFKKDCIGNQIKTKSSVHRALRAQILEQFPKLEPYLDDIIPKKTSAVLVKCTKNITLIVINKDILFFREREGPYIPTVRLVHRYPFMCVRVQVDEGATEYILGGSHIMCPGLTSPGGRLDEDFGKETVVAVMVNGKEHALGVGITTMSRDEIRAVNKGVCITLATALNDGLWHMPTLD